MRTTLIQKAGIADFATKFADRQERAEVYLRKKTIQRFDLKEAKKVKRFKIFIYSLCLILTVEVIVITYLLLT